jgi:ribosomal protein S18 acetylase RimI-like enzyme
MPELLLRPALQDDLEILWRFLAIAAYEPNSAAAKAVRVVALHLSRWQRTCDFGVIAEHGGVAIGAAWARQFSKVEEPIFYVNDRTPEVSIGVVENLRGQSVGTSLLRALRLEADRRDVSLCLNVRDTNPAVRLYQKIGFQRVLGTEIKNRVGGFSFGMILATDRQFTPSHHVRATKGQNRQL